MRLLLCLAVCFVSTVALSTGFSARSSGPDFGGNIPLVVNPTVHTSTGIIVASPGLLLSNEGHEISGATLIAATAAGQVIDQDQSERDGGFTFITPAGSMLYLTVPGTSVVNVPFVPGQPLVVVLP